MSGRKRSSSTKVTGIGGIFFKAKYPKRMAAWYQKNLGVGSPEGMADFAWRHKDNPKKMGRTVWSIFPHNTDYFGRTSPAFMINYRVANLERLLKRLKRAKIKIDKVEEYDYGRFAWITDPEGNRIELWEPVSD